MPFVFGIVGILLVVSGVRGTTSQLAALVKSDFTGKPNYLEWMVAIFLVGSIGYIKDLAPLSRAFMVALIISMFFANKGVFSMFEAGIGAEPQANTFNAEYGTSAPQTTSVQPSDALQLGESLLQNSGVE
jgi:uncharacterized membrane protein HdeD (DUF308 family)